MDTDSTHNTDGDKIEFDLRAREHRISDAELSLLSQNQEKEEIIAPEIGRLSRKNHIVEPSPSSQTSYEKAQDIGHIESKEEKDASKIEIASLADQPCTSEEDITAQDTSFEVLQEDVPQEIIEEFVPKETKKSGEGTQSGGMTQPRENDTISSSSSSKKSVMGETIKFFATSVAIFLLVFVGLNFESYSVLVDDFFNPGKNAERSEELKKALKDTSQFERVALLPVAGIERQKPPPKLKSFINIVPPDNRLIIEKIGKNIPIVSGVGFDELMNEDWEGLEDQIQLALKDGVVHYPATADAGEIGNFFLTGHSSFYFWDSGKYKDVFALLGKLEVGDTYTVYFDQKKYVYKIFEKKIVSPEDTAVLNQPTDEKIGTLMTCWPTGSVAYRMIYRAHQIEPAA